MPTSHDSLVDKWLSTYTGIDERGAYFYAALTPEFMDMNTSGFPHGLQIGYQRFYECDYSNDRQKLQDDLNAHKRALAKFLEQMLADWKYETQQIKMEIKLLEKELCGCYFSILWYPDQGWYFLPELYRNDSGHRTSGCICIGIYRRALQLNFSVEHFKSQVTLELSILRQRVKTWIMHFSTKQ
jgi:hypothetical protein